MSCDLTFGRGLCKDPEICAMASTKCQGHSHPKLLVALGMGSKSSADKIQPTTHKLMVMGNTLVWFPGH